MKNQIDTSTMTEFEKFVCFTGRFRDLEELRKLYSRLLLYAHVSSYKFYPRIKKEFGINGKQFTAYYQGKEPLPYDFLWRFRFLFKNELEEARIEQYNQKIDHAIAENKRFTERAMKVLNSKQSTENASI